MSRETDFELYFPAVTYYDGAGLHGADARARSTSALELDGSKVCVQDGTTTAAQRRRLSSAPTIIKYQEVKSAKLDEVREGLRGRQVQRAHRRRLAALRAAAEARQAGRSRHPARRDLQGAAGAGGAAARRRLDDDREVDAVCDDQRRGARHQLQEHRRGAEVEEAGRDAAGRHRGRLWRGARPLQGLGGAHHPPCRQLRRSLRAQCRQRARSSASRAASTSCGAPAASSTPRRSGSRRTVTRGRHRPARPGDPVFQCVFGQLRTLCDTGPPAFAGGDCHSKTVSSFRGARSEAACEPGISLRNNILSDNIEIPGLRALARIPE